MAAWTAAEETKTMTTPEVPRVLCDTEELISRATTRRPGMRIRRKVDGGSGF